VSEAIIPDFIIIRHNGDIGCPPPEILNELDDLFVSAVGGLGEDASDPGRVLIAAVRVLRVTVKYNNTFERRMSLAPSRYLKGESISRVLQSSVEAGLKFRNPVDDIVAIDE